ncbi:MAG: NAD(P)(+) transhydrogenase (Re/Si-specific) subunit beta, partial [Bacteroidetes bacterium]|nr:NAD(P)(+) transhydrogenase (Re/Si-specific) subunit beta [Bacteroidota bacterium]
GYSGVPNPLYENSKTIMMIGDAKESANELVLGLSDV